MKRFPVGASNLIQWPSPKFHLLKQKKSYREKVRESFLQSYALDFLPNWVKMWNLFSGAIFLRNRASAVSLWCSVALDLMADFFQAGWRFWQKAGSCGMRWLGKGEFPDAGQGLPWESECWDTRAFLGHRAEDTWPRVKPWWGGALRPWHTPFLQGLPQFISLLSGCLSCWPWSLIPVQARDLSVPMQNQIILSILAYMTGADSWKRVLRSSLNAHFCPKSKSLVLHCQFLQHPSPDEGNLYYL